MILSLFRSPLPLLALATALHAETREVQLVVAKAITPEMADNGSPVKIPTLDYYAKLWTESLVTTRALPPPEAPAGPNFTDALSLTGSYEMNGKVVAVLIDRTTSNVLEAYIGEENAEGMKIVEVDGKSAADIARVKLQKGTEVGWVALPDPSNPEGGAPPPGGEVPGGVMKQPQATGGLMPNPAGVAPPAAAVPPQSIKPELPVPVPQPIPQVPQVPQVPDPVLNDIPLPPP
jgi:hypothetical protein